MSRWPTWPLSRPYGRALRVSSFAAFRQNSLLRTPVAMVENTLGKRLLQLVEKPVLLDNLFRVTAVQKLVQGLS
jgi:hypothetical protein